MRSFLWLVMLAACERGMKDNSETPAPTPVVAPIADAALATADGFADWHRITPSEERLRCANHADDEWAVFIDNGTVRARVHTPHEPNTGPELPFALPKSDGVRGRRHVLPVADGFLVGHDAGEWGGSLWWFSKDGKQKKELAKENVHGIVAIGGAVVALEGLAHLSLDEGRARWLDPKGWKEIGVDALDGSPQAFAEHNKGIYVATTKGLTRIDGPKQVRVMQSIRTSLLYPDTMVVDAKGQIWMGMRQLVVRFVPNGDKFDQEWLAPPNCREAVLNDYNCICK